MADDNQDRRAQPRHLACFPAHLESAGTSAQHTTLIRDVSVTGALLFSQRKLDVGEPVKLEMFVSLDDPPGPPRAASGRIVRCEQRALERSDVWRWDIAVQFDEPLADIEAELEQLSARLKRRGVFGA